MRVLVACEFSGVVREAFRKRGHDAWSCDLLQSEDRSPFHFWDSVERHIDGKWNGRSFDPWDLMIAHPPCTYLSVSGLHWNKRVQGRQEKTEKALDFVRILMMAPTLRIAIENPVSCISTAIRKPDQIIQPWQFGHYESKKTCLWLKNLPPLKPTNVLQLPQSGRWHNQTKSGQNKIGPSADRWKLRSRTYQGIADAMADQWGVL